MTWDKSRNDKGRLHTTAVHVHMCLHFTLTFQDFWIWTKFYNNIWFLQVKPQDWWHQPKHLSLDVLLGEWGTSLASLGWQIETMHQGASTECVAGAVETSQVLWTKNVSQILALSHWQQRAWETHLNSLGPSFLIYKVRIKSVSEWIKWKSAWNWFFFFFFGGKW